MQFCCTHAHPSRPLFTPDEGCPDLTLHSGLQIPCAQNSLGFTDATRIRRWLGLSEGGETAMAALAFLVGGDYHEGADRVGLKTATASLRHLLQGQRVRHMRPSKRACILITKLDIQLHGCTMLNRWFQRDAGLDRAMRSLASIL